MVTIRTIRIIRAIICVIISLGFKEAAYWLDGLIQVHDRWGLINISIITTPISTN